MAGARIEIQAKGWRKVEERLNDLARFGRDLTPVFNDVGRMLMRTTRARFAARGGPDGTPWAPLSETTKARKRRNRGKILVHEGELKDSSLSFESDRGGALFGSDKIYAGTHQFGRAEQPGLGPFLGAAIPARPFIGLSDADEAEIEDIVEDRIRRAAGGVVTHRRAGRWPR